MQNSKLTQHQQLKQKLTPQQLLSIKLLSLPVDALEQQVKEEIEKNIVLEEEPQENQDGEPVEISVDDLLHESEASSIPFRPSTSFSDITREKPIEASSSIYDMLDEQIGFSALDENEQEIARFIVRSVDEDGYLRRDAYGISDDLVFKLGIDIPAETVERLISVIQHLEPAGFGSRNVQEFFLIQLSQMEQNGSVKDAVKIISSYFEEFGNRRFDFIIEDAGLDKNRFLKAVDIIKSLTPKPADLFPESNDVQDGYVTPDFFVASNEGNLSATLNSYNIPSLRINRDYLSTMKSQDGEDGGGKSATQFIRRNINEAQWFIQALQQRKQTLLNVMRSILELQRAFFLSGDEADISPMTMKDVAQRIGMDISTVSRVVNGKYALTSFGLVHLKDLFTEGVLTSHGEEVSTKRIQSALRDIVAGEDKKSPYTDEELLAILKKQGFPIARRTVAKYREVLGIPVARLRKDF